MHSRKIHHSKLYERALRIVSKDHFSSFEKLLSKDKSVTVHEKNPQILASEMYEIAIKVFFQKSLKTFLKRKLTTLNALIISKMYIKAVR